MHKTQPHWLGSNLSIFFLPFLCVSSFFSHSQRQHKQTTITCLSIKHLTPALFSPPAQRWYTDVLPWYAHTLADTLRFFHQLHILDHVAAQSSYKIWPLSIHTYCGSRQDREWRRKSPTCNIRTGPSVVQFGPYDTMSHNDAGLGSGLWWSGSKGDLTCKGPIFCTVPSCSLGLL